MIGILVVATLTQDIPLPWSVVGHEGRTVIVVLNGLWLLRTSRYVGSSKTELPASAVHAVAGLTGDLLCLMMRMNLDGVCHEARHAADT